MPRAYALLVAALTSTAFGCATTSPCCPPIVPQSASSANGNDSEKEPQAKHSDDKSHSDKDKQGAKTLFEWAIGPKDPKEADKDEAKHSEPTENKETGPNGNGNVKEREKPTPTPSTDDRRGQKDEEKPLDTDRPDFGAATTTVGKGRAILETGYTFYQDRSGGERFSGHSLPDAVLRVGMFADWFEFRIGESYANFTTTPITGLGGIGNGIPVAQTGAQDLYLGTKLALTEQKQYLPESVIILQSTVPTGSESLTSGKVLPGLIYLYSWSYFDDRLNFSGLVEADKVVNEFSRSYVQLAQTLEVKIAWTSRLRTFLEWVALYPMNAGSPRVGPEYYMHPGFMYYITKNIQLDAHVFIGMNKHTTDFFGGPGLSIRY